LGDAWLDRAGRKLTRRSSDLFIRAPRLVEPGAQAAAAARSATDRLVSIDVLRGLIMVIMAIDHTRDFLHLGSHGLDPTDPLGSNPALFATRWVTHLCAPTFMLLAGLSAWLRQARGDSRGEVARYLITRGLWLIALDATVMSFGLGFGSGPVFLTVLWAIGGSMLLLAAFLWLPPPAVLATGLVIIAGHNLLDGLDPQRLGDFAAAYGALLGRPGSFDLGVLQGRIAYSIVPWFGVMALGYGLGPLFRKGAPSPSRTLALAGFAMAIAFVALRGLDAYGDPVHWTAKTSAARTAMAFLQVTKYPPSLEFVLVTVGPVLLLLAGLERVHGPVARVLQTFGQVPLFFYVAHFYLIHLATVVVGLAQGLPLAHAMGFPGSEPRLGLGLGATYAVWAGVVIVMYPLCAWYGAFRRRHRQWGWLSYL
jgi:uncharacterized membrane protein